MNTVRSTFQQFSLPIFFILAYALSWFPSIFEAHSILPLGPLLAALIVLAIIGWPDVKDFLRRIVQWQVGIFWYGLVLLLPLIITGGAVVFNIIIGARASSWENVPSLAELPATFISILLFIGLGEEPAWRGFALARLQKGRSALTASLLLGILHIVWHLPLFGFEYNLTNIVPWTLGVLGFTITSTWIYNRTQGNLLLPMLLHTSVNVTAKYLFNTLFTGIDLIHLWWLWAGLWCIPAFAILVTNGANLARPISAERQVGTITLQTNS